MRIKQLLWAAAMTALLSGCAAANEPSDQTSSLFPESPAPEIDSQPEDVRSPINFTSQIGMWFPYMYYADYLADKSEDEFRAAVREKYTEAKAEGVNTLYLHVHPCGDAYYRSDLFPAGTYFTDQSYDPFEIMLEEAHSLGLSAHAWINPLRCQTSEQMDSLPDSFIVKQWASSPESSPAVLIGDRWYLDPSYPEVTQLIADCVDEILTRYNADGIHIDDYFYPTTDPEFDREQFAASGSSDLEQWRMDNCSRFVKAIYDTVKRRDERLEFGISPQGNINSDYDTQYADVRRWGSEDGFCDYLVPQLYFGFKNAACPFAETLSQWEALVTNENIRLIIGLAPYKLGREDLWAGEAGKNEWIDSPDIIKRQTELVNSSSAAGYALYY